MIIGAAEEHCLAIRAAQKLGLKVFVTDGNPTSPGFAEANAFAVASTYDYKATLQRAKEYIAQGGRIDGVMTLAADVPYTVAYVADKLGLPNIGISAALNASDKIRMKECFKSAKVPIPLYKKVKNRDHLFNAVEEFGLPIVVKPVDSRGARGVQLIKDVDKLLRAYEVAHSYSPSGRVMVEQYLDGPQISAEGFMVDGKAYIPAIFDRNYEYLDRFKPFIIENGGEMPSAYSKDYKHEIHAIMEQAALALGINTGVIKGDLVIHNGQIKVIEIAARLSGGFFGTVATPASCGVDLVRLNITLCLESTIDVDELEHKFEKAAAIRFAFPEPGHVRSIKGLDKVLDDPFCCYANVFVREGDILQPISNHPGRPAVVVAKGSDLDEAICNAKRLIGMLEWDIESFDRHKEHNFF